MNWGAWGEFFPSSFTIAGLQDLLRRAGRRVCHVSRDHLIRLLRKEIGQTPAQFILERGASNAAQQLIFTSDSIERIAERNGFLDRFHFSRMFKARMGTPLATYRKRAPRY